MTYFHYYATTSRNLDRVMQYGVFPLSKAFWLIALTRIGDGKARSKWAADMARYTSAAVYAGLTTAFLGAESQMIDGTCKNAVAAEMGVDPAKLRFSDYKHSDNAIAKTAHKDIMRLQKYRYGTDALYMLPIGLRKVSEWTGIKYHPHSRELLHDIEHKKASPTFAEMMISGHNAWDFSVLAGKAGYWAGETYFVDKSGNYEIVKVLENLGSTGKDMSANDLLGVYQRTRVNDRGLSLIDRKEEYEALRPLLKRMAEAYNKHDGKFGLSEIVYLIGLNKVNIHAPDNKNISQDAIDASNKEIDRVLAIGLKGIREENKKLNEAKGLAPLTERHQRSFTERFGDGAVGTAQSLSGFMSRILSGNKPRRPEEYVTPRDPGEVAHWDRGINR